MFALFGFGAVGKIIKHKPADRAAIERVMKKEGTMKANGTVSVDTAFDYEINAILRELNAVDAEAAKQLRTLPDEL